MKSKITKRSVKCFIVIIGVVIIPLLYSYFYLGAFWDPYSKLESLPVAVVNNDKGATINDEERNLGQEMCDRLKEDGSLKFIFTNEEDAKSGTEGNDYYAKIVIPEDFSKNIASASTTKKQTATINYSPNQKSNFLASQILGRAVLEIEEETRSNISAELVNTLADKLRDVPNQMADLQDGMNKLYDGSNELSDGAKDLADGTNTFNNKINEYKDGVSDAKDGSKDLKDGMVTLDSGIHDLLEGANKLTASTENIDQLTDGSKSLAAGAKQLNESLIQYTAGVDTLITTVNSTSTFLTNYVTKVNPAIMKDKVFAAFITKMADPANATSITTLQDANTKLKDASTQIAAGAATLSAGTSSLPELKQALNQLSAGLTQAKSGSETLAEGSKTLYSGLSTINSATGKLSNAAGEISDGASKLSDGSVKLNDGIEEAKTGVDDSITDADSDLKALDGLSDYAKTPVSIVETDIYPVPNYGTAFTPYFLSLSLWVGALIMFFGIYLDADGRFKILSRASENKVARSFCYLVIGLTQAVVLAIVVQFGLGLEIANIPIFYAACCLVSMVDIAIVQFCLVHLKDLGKFIAIALLILQLTSCGGTFPMEIIPKTFGYLYPFMPMTYAVGLFKNAISGVASKEVVYNGGILCAILVVFMVLTIMFSVVKFKKDEKVQSLVG